MSKNLKYRKPRKKSSWRKLVVDGKTIHVFSFSEVTKKIRVMTNLTGIELQAALKEERAPFLKRNKKLLQHHN